MLGRPFLCYILHQRPSFPKHSRSVGVTIDHFGILGWWTFSRRQKNCWNRTAELPTDTNTQSLQKMVTHTNGFGIHASMQLFSRSSILKRHARSCARYSLGNSQMAWCRTSSIGNLACCTFLIGAWKVRARLRNRRCWHTRHGGCPVAIRALRS